KSCRSASHSSYQPAWRTEQPPSANSLESPPPLGHHRPVNRGDRRGLRARTMGRKTGAIGYETTSLVRRGGTGGLELLTVVRTRATAVGRRGLRRKRPALDHFRPRWGKAGLECDRRSRRWHQ